MSLQRARRGALVAFSVGLYAAWLVSLGSGIDALGDAGSSVRTLRVPAFASPAWPARLEIRRDPFAPDDAVLANGGPPEDPTVHVPDVRAIRDSDFAAGGKRVRSSAEVLALRATITGPNSVAYVQDGTNMLIVRVGDDLAGRTVREIDLSGIVLSDGTRLTLSSERPAPRTAQKPRATLGQQIEALRKQLLQERQRTLERGRTSSPAGQATPEPTLTFPPPGPLPTIVPNFLPVGVSPTSDPDAPTPYPLPPLRPNF